jgi:3-oxoacyl-[acyl-carrier-protein] synthase II
LKRRVVITGVGVTTAHGHGKALNWKKIVSGVSAIREITSFDSSKYRGTRGGEIQELNTVCFSRLRPGRLDRASHMLIGTVREALSDARYADGITATPVLVSLGTTLGGMLSGEAFHKEALAHGLGKARLSLLSDYLAHSQAVNLFKELDLKGDFRVFSNACASGANAVGHACASIRRNEYDVAICGGYDTMSEFTFAGFNSLMAVTPGLCRPFDKNRNGLVLGEGAGIMVLEELGRATARNAPILGEVIGYGESSDAYHMTSPEPSGTSAAAAISRAWEDAGRPPIDYINAHGTGTPFNDVMEAGAIRNAFGDGADGIPVSSIKPMLGHLLGGAGAVEAIISLLAVLHKTLPPTINYETPDPECPLNIITEPVRSDARTVLSNSFGFGGSNACLVIREFPWEG